MQSKFDSINKVWHGPKLELPFGENFMVGDLIYRNLLKEPERVLQIIEEDESKVTCEDLRINAVRIVQNLQKLGIAADDVVSIVLQPSAFASYVINACVLLGAVINPLTDILDDADLQHLISLMKPKIIICEESAVLKIEKNVKSLKINIPIYSTEKSAMEFLKPTGTENQFSVPKFSKTIGEKLIAILCSSGTTGRPKGVSIAHESILQLMPVFVSSNNSISLSFSSLFWGTGFLRCVFTAMSFKDLQIVTKKPFNDETFIEIVEKFKVTKASMAPRHLSILLNSKKFLSSNAESLVNFSIAGSILSNNLRLKFEEIFPNKQMFNLYGLTENGVSATLPNEYKTEFCVGSMLISNIEVKICDDDERVVDVRQPGEIRVKSNFRNLGYYNQPELTKSAIDSDGFFKTGDIGYFDEKSRLYVIDRKKDIFKSNDYHINPSDIENVIESIEGIQHVCVVGIPDDVSTNLIAAAIVRRKGFEELNEEKIKNVVAANFAAYKQLQGGVFFFDEFPFTISDKIKRKAVLEVILKLKDQK